MSIDPSTFERVIYEVKDHIATVTLNRPERMNALDTTMHKELYQVWRDVKYNDDVDVIIITGAGDRGFCSGADIREAAEARASGASLERWSGRAGQRQEGLSGTPIEHEIWKPMITAINGTCAGGGFHFVWMADFAICVPEATFLEPHVSVGQVPVREMLGMATRMPLSYVLRMAYMGTKERIDAEKALRLGIVTEIVPREQLLERARELALAMMSNNMACIRATKEILFRSLNQGLDDSIRQGFLIAGQDWVKGGAKEGAIAFAERRQAEFRPS
jgi:enoyl-CoA hydratase/carnithine racemase